MKKHLNILTWILGIGSLIWFLIRVIPKPSRAAYPCQQAAFPLASAFVVWLAVSLSGLFLIKKTKEALKGFRWAVATIAVLSFFTGIVWINLMPASFTTVFGKPFIDGEFTPAIGYDWKPGEPNKPLGTAQGIFPGRVVMARNPQATKWAGNWQKTEDQWWLSKNTDVDKVDEMVSIILQKLTGAKTDRESWEKIFAEYHKSRFGLTGKYYSKGEIVAIKINANNSSPNKTDNQTDATPQMVLSVVRQLVNVAGVPQNNIIIYDARRYLFPAMLTTIWGEFNDVRFMQEMPATSVQPVHPKYGDHRLLESANWVEGISYSAGNYNQAKLMPLQIKEATYIINLALLKLHSYPYNYMEDGDEGQTALTMTGKNHAGSIKGTAELHAILNTKIEGKKNAYSPLVDLEASPNLGQKTILYMLDGLYCGRKWRSYPLHFPNPPFNNRVTPYENPDWPACVLASFDGVAIQSVGLDIMYAQSKNNNEPSYHNVPRILVRDNADDFLREMAMPQNAPSGVKYMQNGQPVKSLGVFEHWDNDKTMRYSRNIDPANGKGIEFIYIPIKK